MITPGRPKGRTDPLPWSERDFAEQKEVENLSAARFDGEVLNVEVSADVPLIPSIASCPDVVTLCCVNA